ncbi:MAG: hypothetical protein ACT4QD_12650 [Acidobacteriota bacterium]
MADPEDDLATVAAVVDGLAALGFAPILVGGMALVLLGSQRVTTDFDFVISHPRERLQDMVDVFYRRGFELISRLNVDGGVTATIDNRRVAAIRLRLDGPSSAYFFNPVAGLRVDVLFDFPIPAAELGVHAKRMRVGSHVFRVASEADLLRLKKIARKHRSFAGDAQDIEFLRRRRTRS